MSLKSLFIFTTLVAIGLACVSYVKSKSDPSYFLYEIGFLILFGLTCVAVVFLIGGRFGAGVVLTALLVLLILSVLGWFLQALGLL